MGLKESVVAKLHPSRFRVSPLFTAILACMLEQTWTSPALAELTVTEDGCLLGRQEGDYGFNEFIGSAVDLRNNIEGAAQVAGLTPRETVYLKSLAPMFRM